MALCPLMAWRPKPGGRAGHAERADGPVFRTSIAGKRATSSGLGFRNSRLSRPTTKMGKTGSRAGRSARGVCPGGWRSEVTGEAEKPPERPGYPVNAEPSSAGPGRAPFGLPAIWLRVNCRCAHCWDSRNGERLVSITDLPREVSVSTARRAGDRVAIAFGAARHRGAFDVGWLSPVALAEAEAGGEG